jgi:uncharacterized protein with FMN-binding domain
MLKKIIVGLFVAGTFFIYSLHQRSEGNAAVTNVTNSNSTANNTANQSTSTPLSGSTTGTATTGKYKDGSFTGSEADAFYGYIQVKAIITGGKLADVIFLQYPNDRRDSIQINEYAMPKLKQQAITTQSAKVDGVSGATDTSQAFIQSLGDALSQAKS